MITSPTYGHVIFWSWQKCFGFIKPDHVPPNDSEGNVYFNGYSNRATVDGIPEKGERVRFYYRGKLTSLKGFAAAKVEVIQ
jgi:cold shock CspA family protein